MNAFAYALRYKFVSLALGSKKIHASEANVHLSMYLKTQFLILLAISIQNFCSLANNLRKVYNIKNLEGVKNTLNETCVSYS